MARGWVIEKKATRRALICAAREQRHHWANIPEDEIQVSESTLASVNAATMRYIRDLAAALPSKGKTIK